MEEAEDAYSAKLSGQSETLEAAIQQYKKRYQHDPLRGFDEWWAFGGHELRLRAGRYVNRKKKDSFPSAH